MIKFFQKIRFQLLEHNKTGRYLKYAIGEILLVVIGILIALQVSDWNETRKKAIAEQFILNDLKTELNLNIKDLQETIDEHEHAHQATIKVMSIIKDLSQIDNVPNDSLKSIISDMHMNWTFNPKLGVLNSTINSGKIDLIQSKDLRNKLSSINEFIIDAAESTLSIERNRENIFWQLIAINAMEKMEDGQVHQNNKKILSDTRFVWWTKYMNALRKEGLEEEHQLMDFLKDINQKIDLEIK